MIAFEWYWTHWKFFSSGSFGNRSRCLWYCVWVPKKNWKSIIDKHIIFDYKHQPYLFAFLCFSFRCWFLPHSKMNETKHNETKHNNIDNNKQRTMTVVTERPPLATTTKQQTTLSGVAHHPRTHLVGCDARLAHVAFEFRVGARCHHLVSSCTHG